MSFTDFDASDIRDLIAEYPLAWVTAGTAASLLPLIGVYDDGGKLVELVGHLARANPLHAALSAQPRSFILFRGPEGYISPEHAALVDWAPTWNYAQLTVEADVRFDAGGTFAALDILIAAMETGRANPWSIDLVGPRSEHLIRAIIGFRATVASVRGKFKLGQDERPETLQSILARHPDAELRRWMRRFNPGRA